MRKLVVLSVIMLLGITTETQAQTLDYWFEHGWHYFDHVGSYWLSVDYTTEYDDIWNMGYGTTFNDQIYGSVSNGTDYIDVFSGAVGAIDTSNQESVSCAIGLAFAIETNNAASVSDDYSPFDVDLGAVWVFRSNIGERDVQIKVDGTASCSGGIRRCRYRADIYRNDVLIETINRGAGLNDSGTPGVDVVNTTAIDGTEFRIIGYVDIEGTWSISGGDPGVAAEEGLADLEITLSSPDP